MKPAKQSRGRDLPAELLEDIFELVCDNPQKSSCAMLRQMNAVATPILFEKVIVKSWTQVKRWEIVEHLLPQVHTMYICLPSSDQFFEAHCKSLARMYSKLVNLRTLCVDKVSLIDMVEHSISSLQLPAAITVIPFIPGSQRGNTRLFSACISHLPSCSRVTHLEVDYSSWCYEVQIIQIFLTSLTHIAWTIRQGMTSVSLKPKPPPNFWARVRLAVMHIIEANELNKRTLRTYWDMHLNAMGCPPTLGVFVFDDLDWQNSVDAPDIWSRAELFLEADEALP
jgi:hypothetical protein